MYMRNSSKKRKYLIVKLFGTRSCDGSLYVCSCRYNGCINRRDVHITPSQIIADNANALARAQYTKRSCEKSGERENHTIVSECHKPNSSGKTKSVLLATKSEMREVRK